ncbi:MAG: hypothetical protein LIP01_05590 [Tannerellaceae bacterium]|nr:hypothetical protein [Tannerellaceae bacterium]
MKLWNEGPPLNVYEVSEPIRPGDYEVSEACYFFILNQQEFPEWVKSFTASSAEVCVRMRQYKTAEEMNDFLADISEQLIVNNLYVHGMTPLETRREEKLQSETRQVRIAIILLVFMMINVFLDLSELYGY